MNPETPITSMSNPLVKRARSLRNRKARAETGLFLVEGLLPVGAAIEAGWELEALLYSPGLLASDFGRGLVARSQGGKPKPQMVSAEVMESLAGKDNPQGILALARQRRLNLETWPPAGARVGAALVGAQDPGNVGTILRTLDGSGADSLFLLDGGVDPFHPTSVRAGMGAHFWIPIIEAGFTEFARWARQSGRQLIGSSAHAEQDFRSFVPQIPWILVLGSEQKGLSAEQLAACDAAVSIPMRGRAGSLNLAAAASVLLYSLAPDAEGRRDPPR